MEFMSSQNSLIIAVVALLAGLLLGVAGTLLLERRKAGGKSVEKLREEFDDYRDKVASHFNETSDLFRDMTEKYRDVYNHLAEGSQVLCEDPMQHGRLEFIDRQETSSEEPVAQQDDVTAKAKPPAGTKKAL